MSRTERSERQWEPSPWGIRLIQMAAPRRWTDHIEEDLLEHFERRIGDPRSRILPLIYLWDVFSLLGVCSLQRISVRLVPVVTAPFSRALHYPIIYLLLALSIFLPTPTVFRTYVAVTLAGAGLLGLVLGIGILAGKIRPDVYWGKAAGNFMLAFYSTLCIVHLFLKELTLEQWDRAYGFTLGAMLVFVLRWLWPQLFDPDSEWGKKQRELTVLRIPREVPGSGDKQVPQA